MKRVTTRKGPPQTRKVAGPRWKRVWKELEQWRIQRWIERIPLRIPRIIELEGGKEYAQGKYFKANEQARLTRRMQRTEYKKRRERKRTTNLDIDQETGNGSDADNVEIEHLVDSILSI